MKNIFILSVLAILLFTSNFTHAQDYFKERRYDGIDFTKRTVRKQYVTISRKKYELVDKEEEQFLGQKISFDKSQRLFYIKRQKKAMTFKETINFMKYVGNEKSAKQLKGGLNLLNITMGLRLGGTLLGGVGGLVLASNMSDSEPEIIRDGIVLFSSGVALYGLSYLSYSMGQKKINKTIRYHNKNVRKFSKPVIAANDFIPSSLGFKPVRTNLLNPTPVAALSMSWSF